MSKELLKKAEIGVSEFAKLAGVSRVTASLWINGHAAPHQLHKEKIERLWVAISIACGDCTLPLGGKVPKEDRAAKLAEVIAAHS